MYIIDPSEEDRYILINHEEAPVVTDEKTKTLESGSSGAKRRNSTIETKINKEIPILKSSFSNYENWDEQLRIREEIYEQPRFIQSGRINLDEFGLQQPNT